MKSLWHDAEAGGYEGHLGVRVYTSRLLGRDRTLVLHGGGNTSVKVRDPAGNEILHVKGTGSDLAQVDVASFVPLYLARVRELFDHGELANDEMMRLLGERALRAGAPRPSIETMLHAALPFQYVEHTHADSILAVANVEDGERIVAEVYGELAPLVPYHHSGAGLARACRDVFGLRATQRTIGLILRFHGVIAFGESARDSYENMLRLVTIAEDYLKRRSAWDIPAATGASGRVARGELAALRARAARCAGFPLVMQCHRDPACLAFARRDDLNPVALQGPPTPQHAVFTKRVPQLGCDVDAYAEAYRSYLRRTLGTSGLARIDPAPRVVLDPHLGLCALGVNPDSAAVTAEAYRHDIEIITRASAHGRYCSAPEKAIALAELEYGGYEARLRSDPARPLLGTVALIAPGAASIDPALPGRLLDQGAAVGLAGANLRSVADNGALQLPAHDVDGALDAICLAFGGVDTVYLSSADFAWAHAARDLLDHSLAEQRTADVTRRAPSPA